MSISMLSDELFVDGIADYKFGDLKAGQSYRVIGGDLGDLLFHGYYINHGKTYLVDAALRTNLELTEEDEIYSIAQGILDEAFNSVGYECLV
jgi:hypothetical protein